MEIVYNRYHQHVAVCADCLTSLTVPGKAWGIAAVKKAQKQPKPEQEAG